MLPLVVVAVLMLPLVVVAVEGRELRGRHASSSSSSSSPLGSVRCRCYPQSLERGNLRHLQHRNLCLPLDVVLLSTCAMVTAQDGERKGEQEKGKVKADVDDVAVRQVRRYYINSEREESRQTGLETVTFVPKTVTFVPEYTVDLDNL